MTRLLSTLSILALATAASAQCYEANLGTLVGTGDDTLFGVQPMNMTFPMGGVAATYDALQFNTNGVIYLTNGATAAVGTTTTGYSGTAATMVTNLRGAAGNSPRIAPYWRDLNMLAANGGGVYLNNTIPGKCVVTWKNAVHYAQTAPIFTVQAQLWADGHVDFFYNNTLQNSAICPIVGVSQGNGVADPGVSNLAVANVGVSTSKIVYQTFATLNTMAGFQNKVVSFFPNAGGGYDTGIAACVPAQNVSYGSGCYNRSGTAYEAFAANSIDLSGVNIHMTPNGVGGYLFTPGYPTAFVHTVPSLMLSDDSVGTLALPSAFPYPGGSTTSMSVCSNGYIWMQTNTLADFSPTAAELFSNPARICPMWCDGLPDGATGVNNVWAEVDTVNNKAYVTYVNVPIFGGVGGTINLQTEFNLTTGEINIAYGAVSCGNVSVVGWTPGTGVSSLDVGSRDFSASLGAGFQTVLPESPALALAVAGNPILGTTITATTSNIPATALLSAQMISLAQINPGLDLGFMGAPGCLQLVDLNLGTSAVMFGNPTATYSIALPNNGAFAGLPLTFQSASLDPTANALGILTSNGVLSVLNTF